MARQPFFAWPGWPHVRTFLGLAVPVTIWFLTVYGVCDLVAGYRSRHHVHIDCELAVPFVPASVVVYDSVYPVMWLAPFVLRARRELVAYALAQAGVVAAAGVGFMIYPAELGFAPDPDAGIWTPLVVATKTAALRYNLVPSLHVGLAVLTTAAYDYGARPAARAALWTWAAALAASTLLLHQHHVIDVVTGWLLGVAGAWGYRWLTARTPPASPATHPAPSP